MISSDCPLLCRTEELELPDWVNIDFLKESLCKFEKTKVIVEEMHIAPVTPLGDHFASIMFRMRVKYWLNPEICKSASFIVKTIPSKEGKKRTFLEKSKLFDTEIAFYSQLLPRIQTALSAVFDVDGRQVAPSCIASGFVPQKYIIFEDLTALAYGTIAKRAYSLKELKNIFRQLAKLHAASFKLLKEDPALFAPFRFGLLTLPELEHSAFFNHGLELFIAMLTRTPDLARFTVYFKSMRGQLMQRNRAAYMTPQSDCYYTLCHGDLHMGNVMIKADSGTARLIDFQIACMGPMVNEVVYALMAILSPEQRRLHMDEMIEFHFNIFLQTLRTIGFHEPQPDSARYREQFLQQRYYLFFSLLHCLSISHGFAAGGVDFEALMSDTAEGNRLFHLPSYINELKYLLPFYEFRGYFQNL